jgi:hypothetical protein
LDARERYRPAIANSGLDTVDQAAFQASPAFGPLITALRRAEHLGLDVPTTLRQAVTQSSLNNANDLAPVLHARIERLITRAERLPRRTPPPLIAGMVTPATHVTNPAYKAAVQEIESQIALRADWLAEDATAGREPWQQTLIDSIDSPTERRQTLLGFAAYRELYRVEGSDVLGPPPAPDAHAQRRQYAHLCKTLDDILRGQPTRSAARGPLTTTNHPARKPTITP